MGQREIAKVLEKNYPDWMSYKDIAEETGLPRTRVMHLLSCMKKRIEVEVKASEVKSKHARNRWLNVYRSNGG